MSENESRTTDFIGVLSRILPTGAPVALLDFPWYENPGDSAIWMGEMLALANLGHRFAYTAALETLDFEQLDRLLPVEGIVLLQGGGNFGDFWPRYHAHRKSIIATLRHRPIVQLPQTVGFGDERAEDASLARLAIHPALKVMARDQPSLERLVAAGIDASLSSDPTTALWPDAPTPHQPDGPMKTLYLLRSDHERRTPIPASLEPLARDWADLGVTKNRVSLPAHLIDRSLDAIDRAQKEFGRALPATCRPRIARQRRHSSRLVAGAIAAILAHDVVVTDRLHGMLFALAHGRPVIAVDTGYGKLDDYADAFLSGNPLLHRLPDFREVDVVLDSLGRS